MSRGSALIAVVGAIILGACADRPDAIYARQIENIFDSVAILDIDATQFVRNSHTVPDSSIERFHAQLEAGAMYGENEKEQLRTFELLIPPPELKSVHNDLVTAGRALVREDPMGLRRYVEARAAAKVILASYGVKLGPLPKSVDSAYYGPPAQR